MSSRRPSTPQDKPEAPTSRVLQSQIDLIRQTLEVLRTSPVTPTSRAQVKLDLREKSDGELSVFAKMHIRKMEDNPNFPLPIPSAEVFDAVSAKYAQLLITAASVRQLSIAVTMALEDSRAEMENALRTRANYIQIASEGSAPKIASAGFSIRSAGSSVGPLDPPTALIVNPTPTTGQVLLTWEGVEGARIYLIQYSDASTMDRDWRPLTPSTERKATISNLPVGQRLAFRLASGGGTTGQSPWSPEVTRTIS